MKKGGERRSDKKPRTVCEPFVDDFRNGSFLHSWQTRGICSYRLTLVNNFEIAKGGWGKGKGM